MMMTAMTMMVMMMMMTTLPAQQAPPSVTNTCDCPRPPPLITGEPHVHDARRRSARTVTTSTRSRRRPCSRRPRRL